MTRNDVLLIGSARLNRYRFLRVDLPFLPTSTDDVDLIFEFLDILRIHYIHGLEILVDTASQNFPITISLVVPSFVDVPRYTSAHQVAQPVWGCLGIPVIKGWQGRPQEKWRIVGKWWVSPPVMALQRLCNILVAFHLSKLRLPDRML